MSKVELSGTQKAAALLVSLGAEGSAQILKHCSEEDIERLTLEIFRMGPISSETREAVVREGYEMSLAAEGMLSGGVDYAREMLARALGNQKAEEFLERVQLRTREVPFDYLNKADPAQLANSLKTEHPQTIALILSHLKASQAAAVIAQLDRQLQGDVAQRIAVMDRVSPDVIKKVETGVKGKLSTVLTEEDYASAGGITSLVNILHQVDRGTEKIIMEMLDEDQPELAEEVRQKMFVFENIINLDSRAIQRVLREVDNKDLVLALKGASEGVRNLIFKNLSKRAAELLQEDLELSGPVRLRNVEDAQQRIVGIIRQLEMAEEIVVSRGGDDDIIM